MAAWGALDRLPPCWSVVGYSVAQTSVGVCPPVPRDGVHDLEQMTPGIGAAEARGRCYHGCLMALRSVWRDPSGSVTSYAE